MAHWTSRLINELRLEAGLSMTALSDLSDVSRSTIAHVERGQHDCRIDFIDALLMALDHEIEVVPISGTGDAKTAKDNSNGASRKR